MLTNAQEIQGVVLERHLTVGPLTSSPALEQSVISVDERAMLGSWAVWVTTRGLFPCDDEVARGSRGGINDVPACRLISTAALTLDQNEIWSNTWLILKTKKWREIPTKFCAVLCLRLRLAKGGQTPVKVCLVCLDTI